MRTSLRHGLALALLTGCACGPEDPPAGDAYDAWREIQTALRSSPDHLVGRAEALLVADDTEGLLALVRDEVALVPDREGFALAATFVRWGADATLRGGAGTARERADLLAALLARAGWTTEIWVGAPATPVDALAIAARPPSRPFSPPVDPARIDAWGQAIGLDPFAVDIADFDPDGAARDAVRVALADAGLDAPSAPPPVVDTALPVAPFVRATRDGVTLDLQPNLPEVPFGESGVVDATPAPPASAPDDLVVELEGVRDDGTSVVWAQGTWDAAHAVGGVLEVAFATPYGLSDAARIRAVDVQTFVPTLRWVPRADRLTDPSRDMVVGDPIDRGGAVWTRTSGGYARDGVVVTTAPSDPAALARVASVRVAVDAATFPQVEARVAVFDEAGQAVVGLGADAFAVLEDTLGQRASLLQSEPVTPRVQLLFDRSSSVPSAYLDDAAAVGHDVAEAIFAAVPTAEIQVAGLDVIAPTVAGGFVTSLAEVDAQLATLGGAGSDVFNNLAATARGEASAVVLISDFAPDTPPDPGAAAAIVAGPPVLLAAVGTPDAEALDTLSLWTSGVVWRPDDAVALADAAAAFVLGTSQAPYLLRWRAPEGASTPRDVDVRLPVPNVAAAATYTPPAEPVAGPSWASAWLTVRSGDRVVRRPLATDAAELSSMWLGRALLAFEAGTPSLSVLIDDHLADRMRYEPLYDALAAADAVAARTAVDGLMGRVPGDLRFAFAEGPDAWDEATVFPDGLRAALWVQRPQWDGPMLRRLDLLSLSRRRGTGPDADAAYATTQRRSAYTAAIEALRFDESTASLLEGEELATFDPLTIDLTLGPAWRAPVDAWPGRQILAPVDGDPVAFWAVDPGTGEVVGVLGDGSGGAVAEDVAQMLREIDVLLDVAERAGTIGGINGISVWVELERTKACLVGAATIVIGEGAPPPDIGEILGGFIDNQFRDGLLGMVPGWDSMASAWSDRTQPLTDLNSLFGLLGAAFGTEAPKIPYTQLTDLAFGPEPEPQCD